MQGFSGDGGPATVAQLNYPEDVEVDATGNIFIADSYNHRVRRVSATGVISTVAGTGVQGFPGDGGAATVAQLNYPAGVAVDATGNIFIADDGNRRVRRVSATGVISTVAGNGVQGFSGDGGPATVAQLRSPNAVAVDSTGNIFIVDWSDSRIAGFVGWRTLLRSRRSRR